MPDFYTHPVDTGNLVRSCLKSDPRFSETMQKTLALKANVEEVNLEDRLEPASD